MTRSCGSTPIRGGVFVVGGAGVPRHSGAGAGPHPGGRSGPMSQTTRPAAVRGEVAQAPDAVERHAVGAAARVEHRRADARADRARLDLGRDVRHLVVAERHELQDGVAGRVRQRVAREVLRVPVGLAAVPQELQQRQDQRALQPVGIGLVEHRRERVEVDAARQQQAVVHGPDVEHRPREVRRHRGQRAARDAALAVAVVEEPPGVDERTCPLGGRPGRRRGRPDGSAPVPGRGSSGSPAGGGRPASGSARGP